VPKKAEWLDRILKDSNAEIDLIEAATVLANDRMNLEKPYSAIPRTLEPYLAKARAKLTPTATPDNTIDVLNQEVLPAIQAGATGEFRWLAEGLSPKGGWCSYSSVLYMIAGDSLALKLEAVSIPQHLFVCCRSANRRRNIETTGNGEHLSVEGLHRLIYCELINAETIPEQPEALEKCLKPITKRQLVAMLLCNREHPEPPTVEDCRNAVRMSPELYFPYKIEAAIALRKGDRVLAEELASQAIERAPYLPGLYAERSAFRAKLGKLADSNDDINTALNLAPRYGMYHMGKASVEALGGKMDEAITSATRAIELAPKVGLFVRIRGLYYEKYKRYKEAIEDFTKAIELEPKWAENYECRARTWALIGDEAHWNEDRLKAKELREKQ